MSYERARPTQWGNYGGLSQYWGLGDSDKKHKKHEGGEGKPKHAGKKGPPAYFPKKALPPVASKNKVWDADPWRRTEDTGKILPGFVSPMMFSNKPAVPAPSAAVLMDPRAPAPMLSIEPAAAFLPPAAPAPEPAPTSPQAAPISPEAPPAAALPPPTVMLRPYPMMRPMPGQMYPQGPVSMPMEANTGGGFSISAPNKSTLAKIGTALAAGLLFL